MTPLAPIAPGFQGRKPIASYQRGRAACESDRALDLIFGKRRRAGLEISHANPRKPANSARPKPYGIRAARSVDETSRPARIAKISVDDFARIGPKATPTRAQESSRDRRVKNPRRKVPVTKTRRRRPLEAFRRRGREGRREVGLSIAKRVGELANKRNGFSHGRRAPHDRFPSIAGRSGLLRDLLQSDVPAFDAYRLRNLVARSFDSTPGDRKRAQLHLSRLRFAADLDLAPLVRSSGDGRGSLIALSGKAPARAARSAPGGSSRPSFWSQ